MTASAADSTELATTEDSMSVSSSTVSAHSPPGGGSRDTGLRASAARTAWALSRLTPAYLSCPAAPNRPQ
jgi:hypothetical protein